jgi:hypothetical protein
MHAAMRREEKAGNRLKLAEQEGGGELGNPTKSADARVWITT